MAGERLRRGRAHRRRLLRRNRAHPHALCAEVIRLRCKDGCRFTGARVAGSPGGGGENPTVHRPAQSKAAHGEGIYALRKVRRSPLGHNRGGGADREASPRARHSGGDGEVRHAVVFCGNGTSNRSDIMGARKPRPKTLRTSLRRKEEGTSVEHWSLRPWRAWQSTLGVPVRSDPLGR
jgi:hypothetical protein